MNYIEKMANRQDSLNEITVKGWISKELNFRRALRLEAAEAMESTPWKWWKSGAIDIDNLRVEAVDMMHFALSVCIMEGYTGWKWLDKEIEELFMKPINIPEEKIVGMVQETIDTIMYMTFVETTASAGPSDLIYEIAKLMRLIGMSRDDMFKLYFAKNVLNEFRQANGYKDGTYIKIWFDKEDNVFMQKHVDDIGISDHFEDDLYNALDTQYVKVVEAK
jgi:dimeric dUTPase (all-alpha-NTP-PPase superfamily)